MKIAISSCIVMNHTLNAIADVYVIFDDLYIKEKNKKISKIKKISKTKKSNKILQKK